MIRRFFALLLFLGTVNLAVFGQHIFGREDIITLGHRIQTEGPQRTAVLWNKTDKMLADLAPEAGVEGMGTCGFTNLNDAVRFYRAS